METMVEKFSDALNLSFFYCFYSKLCSFNFDFEFLLSEVPSKSLLFAGFVFIFWTGFVIINLGIFILILKLYSNLPLAFTSTIIAESCLQKN